jgi:hypothetical protein
MHSFPLKLQRTSVERSSISPNAWPFSIYVQKSRGLSGHHSLPAPAGHVSLMQKAELAGFSGKRGCSMLTRAKKNILPPLA